MSVKKFVALPPSESCRRIGFDKAYVKHVGPARIPTLFVEGEAPCFNMEVRLWPLIYIDCPEYWGIEVVGCLPGGICLTAIKPYHVSIPLAGIIGSRGIEVLGAHQSEKIDLEGGCHSGIEITAE